MLIEQTLEKLEAMRLHGMAKALREWRDQPKQRDAAPMDVMGLVTDAEWMYRENRRLGSRLKNAKLKQTQACIEDIDYAQARGVSKSTILELASSAWVQSHQNVLLTGPTGA